MAVLHMPKQSFQISSEPDCWARSFYSFIEAASPAWLRSLSPEMKSKWTVACSPIEADAKSSTV